MLIGIAKTSYSFQVLLRQFILSDFNVSAFSQHTRNNNGVTRNKLNLYRGNIQLTVSFDVNLCDQLVFAGKWLRHGILSAATVLIKNKVLSFSSRNLSSRIPQRRDSRETLLKAEFKETMTDTQLGSSSDLKDCDWDVGPER